MTEDFVDMAEPKVRLFGIYRTGWTEERKAKFAGRVVRTLFRRGSMTTGQLASYLQITLHDELFQATLKALIEWKMVETVKRPWGYSWVAEVKDGVTDEHIDNMVIELTKTGEFHGMHAACDEIGRAHV